MAGKVQKRKKYKERIGLTATDAGQNAYPLAIFDGTTVQYNAVATAVKEDRKYPLASNTGSWIFRKQADFV